MPTVPHPDRRREAVVHRPVPTLDPDGAGPLRRLPLRGACRGHPGARPGKTKKEEHVNKQQRRALLALPLTIAVTVSACSSNSSNGKQGTKTNVPSSNLPTLDINAHATSDLKDVGTLTWAIEQFGPQWNYNEVNGTDSGIANAMLSMMPDPTRTDEHANVSYNPAYWESAKI